MYIHTHRDDTLAWTTNMFLPPEYAITFPDNLASDSALRNVNHKIFTVLCPLAFSQYPWTPLTPLFHICLIVRNSYCGTSFCV